MGKYDKLKDESLKYFSEHYQILVDIDLTEKIILGNNKKLCRYCGKKSDETTFKKIAHSFPELIGNKFLFSNDECDICNEWFAKNLENELANYLGVSRTVFAVKGKKGIPVYKSNARVSLDLKNDMDKTLTIDNNDVIECDISNKTLKIKVSSIPYIPIAVFKCFVKMAISIMPEFELSKFLETIQWLRNNKHEHVDTSIMKCFEIINKNYIPFIKAFLFKRVCSSSPVPYMIFVLVFNNYVFQLSIPFSKKDRCQAGKDLSMKVLPFLIKDTSQITLVDLSKSERMIDGQHVLSFSYDEQYLK